jgi:hypothetical protein
VFAEHKGGRDARKKISADRSGAAFGRPVRHLCPDRLCPDRKCASTAAVRTYRSNTDAADAIADPQSIQPGYCASSALRADHAFNTERNSFYTKHCSKC